jgi:hypothetical protein
MTMPTPRRAHHRQAGGHEQGPDQHDLLVAAGPADHLAEDGRGDHHAEHHRDRQQAGRGRALAAGDLHVLREEDRRAEQRHAHRGAGDHGEHDGAVLEEVERDERLARAALDEDGGHEEPDAHEDHDGRLPGQPVELVAGEGHPDEQERHAGGDQEHAGQVDVDVAAFARREVQRALQDDDGRDRDRHADVEAPAPADAVGDHAAEERAGDRAHRHDGAEQAHVAAALAGRDEVGEDDLHEGGHAARAEALQDAAGDEPARRLREAGEDRADRVDHERELHEQLAIHEVGELAPDRGGDRQREQRRRDDPREGGLAAAEVADDPRERRRDDGARQDRHEHAEEEAGHGLEHLAVGHGRGARPSVDVSHAASCAVTGLPEAARS